MPLNHIEHYLVLTKDLEATRDFYVNVLGMRDGERPPFDFAGNWFYLGDMACVHVAQVGGEKGLREAPEGDGTGAVDHIAFNASGLAELLRRLDRLGLQARRLTMPDLGLE